MVEGDQCSVEYECWRLEGGGLSMNVGGWRVD